MRRLFLLEQSHDVGLEGHGGGLWRVALRGHAVRVAQKLGEVPHERLCAERVLLSLHQEREERNGLLVVVTFHLVVDREGSAFVVGELPDLLVGSGLLTAKIIAGKSEDLQALL